MSTTHTDGVVTITKVTPETVEGHRVLGPVPTGGQVEQANRALAGRVQALERINETLREQLSNQADTIVRQRKEITEAKGTTLVVKDPQGAIENYRATINQQRERINQLRSEVKTQKVELDHSDDLIREHRRTIVHLQESVTVLVGEVRGSQNEIDRLRHLATCRLHHINSLEDVLEGRDSLLATVNMMELEEHLLALQQDLELLGGVVHEILDERTRAGVVTP